MNLQSRRCACGAVFELARLRSRETRCVPCQQAESRRLSGHAGTVALCAYFGRVQGHVRRWRVTPLMANRFRDECRKLGLDNRRDYTPCEHAPKALRIHRPTERVYCRCGVYISRAHLEHSARAYLRDLAQFDVPLYRWAPPTPAPMIPRFHLGGV